MSKGIIHFLSVKLPFIIGNPDGGYSVSNKIDMVPEVLKANEGMIFGILEANDGSIWFGTLDGVKRFDGKTVNGFNAMSSQEYFSRLVAARDNC